MKERNQNREGSQAAEGEGFAHPPPTVSQGERGGDPDPGELVTWG